MAARTHRDQIRLVVRALPTSEGFVMDLQVLARATTLMARKDHNTYKDILATLKRNDGSGLVATSRAAVQR
jgi:hypothetical protein